MGKHELMSTSIAANVESTAGWDTVEESDKCLPGQFDGFIHRTAPIDQEDVLSNILILKNV